MAANLSNRIHEGHNADIAGISANDATPWTVTRCSEALAELTQLLDQMIEWHAKYLEQQALARHDTHANNRTTLPKEKLGGGQLHGSQAGTSKLSGPAVSEEYSTDLAWASNERRLQKKNKNRYGAHRKMLPKTPNRERLIDLETPFVQQEFRSGANDVNTSFIAADISGLNIPPPPRARGAAGKKKGSRTHLNPVELRPDGSIVRNFDAVIEQHLTEKVWNKYGGSYVSVLDRFSKVVRDFLSSTEDEPIKQPLLGARRLVSMCERRLGRMLADEIVEATEENKLGNIVKSPFTPPVLLNDLQDHFGSEMTGWKPLRHITRALGISLVCKAIEDEVIGNQVIFDLLEKIESRKLEGEDVFITEAALQFRWTMSQTEAFERTILTDLVPVSEDPAYFAPSGEFRRPCVDDSAFRMTAATVRRHGLSLPAHYLSFRSILISEAFSKVFGETLGALGATEFLQSAMVWLLDYTCTSDWLKDGESTQKCNCFGLVCQTYCNRSELRSVCSLLAVYYLQKEQSRCPLVLQVMHFVTTHIERKLQDLAVASNATKQRYLHFMTAFSLMQSAAPVELCAGLYPIVGQILRQTDRDSLTIVKREFATDVVDYCGLHMDTVQDEIRMITERIIGRGLDFEFRGQEFYFDMALEIAMRFAERRRTDDDLKWALSIQDRLSRHRVENSTHALPGTLFRWEESINEWVERTPAPIRNKPNRTHDIALAADSSPSLMTSQSLDRVPLDQIPIQDALDRGLSSKPDGSIVHQTKRHPRGIDIADESGDELATGAPQLKRRKLSSRYVGHLESSPPKMKQKETNRLEEHLSGLADTGYGSEDELKL